MFLVIPQYYLGAHTQTYRYLERLWTGFVSGLLIMTMFIGITTHTLQLSLLERESLSAT